MVWAVSLSTTKLIPRRLTPLLSSRGIQSLSDFGNLVGPLGQTVLYSRDLTQEAIPKYISGRTRYL